MPDPSLFNIFLFHMAVDIPSVSPPQIEAEASPELFPKGFNYYAGGHIHVPNKQPFNDGVLVYSGCTETVSYEDAKLEKGFCHVEVNDKGIPKIHRIKLETPRHFIIVDRDYGSSTPTEITDEAVQLVKEVDEVGAVILPILQGRLPHGVGREEIDLAKIRGAARKALLVRPLLRLRETDISEEVIRSIFESELKDLGTKAFEYFFEIFLERYAREEAEKISRLAINLLEPLVGREENLVKETLEKAS